MGDPVSLESSLLSSAAYSDDGRLQLWFHNATIYQYLDVPPDIFENLLAAESKGQYFNRHIRDQFHHNRLA